MKIQGKVVIVTGGNSGLGLQCVKHLEALGARVAIWDKSECSNPSYIYCDVCSAESVEQAIQQTIQRFGIPQIVINCAGIAPAKRMVGKTGPMPLADFEQVIQVNLIGTFNVMRLAAAAMMEIPYEVSDNEERGVIINTASIAAYEGQIGQLAYSASKGGIVSMTLPAARELSSAAIRVNTIAPGLMATPLLLKMPADVQENLAQSIEFPKRLGQTAEFAALAQHIIENSYLNGETIRLDGALRMQAR